MKLILLASRTVIAGAALAAFIPADALAQSGEDGAPTYVIREPAAIFRETKPLEFTLTANFKALHRSKTKASKEHPAVISWTDDAGTNHEVRFLTRSRGHWRLKNCVIPPLRLNFQKQAIAGTPFEGLDKNRLVMHCRDTDEFDQYVLREFQLYRVWNQLTNMSHRARLARVTYVDSATSNPIATRYAFILEEDKEMAERNGGKLLDAKGAKVGDLDSYHDALVGVFQYMVGNVDWSVAGLHNVLLIQRNPLVYATVYDFDFTGTVRTRYSIPDYRLPIRTVRQRLFRGYCAPAEEFQQVFNLFNEKKDAIFALYRDEIGQLMDPNYVNETVEYFEEFYKVINDPRLARDRIIRACLEAQ